MPQTCLARRSALVWVVAMLVLHACSASAATLGVIGDSLSDEYAEQSYSYADNWVEQLVAYRGVNTGPIGAWGEPRRNFYEYNWARYGATSGDMIASGQHTGLAAQIGPHGIDYAVLAIGANDILFDGSNAYANIYSGTWSPAQINAWAGGVTANINAAINTLLPTGVQLVLVNAPDYGVTPWIQSQSPDAAGRQAVADAITNQLNPQIEALAQLHQLPYVDLDSAAAAIFGSHAAPNSTLVIGNVPTYLMQSDTAGNTNPTAAFVHDGIHPHTTQQGIFANLMLEALNLGYGANIPLFSEQEILAHAGLSYGGSDTLAAQFGDYGDYVTSYVPEPSTLVLAACGTLMFFVTHRRRSSRRPTAAAAAILACATWLLSFGVSHAVTIPTVPVGNAGNAADPSDGDNFTPGVQNFGAVPYDYRIGTTEVTNAQYTDFLNAKAASDPFALYHPSMGLSSNGGITRSGVSGSFTYSIRPNMGDKPVNHVGWNDAMRFINWLHNGQGAGDTENGAYTMSDGLPTRNVGATWLLPTDDEWYKAAYHQPAAQGGDIDDYWLYPTASNSAPIVATANAVGDVSNPGVNVANYLSGADWNSLDGNVTTVGSAGPLSESYYGTSDQGGNVWEYTETSIGLSIRGLRGGNYQSTPDELQSSDRLGVGNPVAPFIGFRVVNIPNGYVPEPSTALLAALGVIGLVWWRSRHK